MKNRFYCNKCNIKMEKGTVRLKYLGRDFSTEMMKCPKCGMTYVTEEQAKDHMKKVEEMLEGK